MLNVDTKILSKAIFKKLKAILPTLISSQQTVCVKNRFIGESDLISDIIQTSNQLNIQGFLLTMVNEKAFDFLGHYFLSSVLKKFGFDKKILSHE